MNYIVLDPSVGTFHPARQLGRLRKLWSHPFILPIKILHSTTGHALYSGTESSKFFLHPLIASIEVVNTVYLRDA